MTANLNTTKKSLSTKTFSLRSTACSSVQDTDMSEHGTNPQGGETPDRLGTSIPTGGLQHGQDPEKAEHHTEKPAAVDDDEDIEDIDALIDDLESQDGGDEDLGVEDAAPGSSARPVPEELLNTDTRLGLTTAEVEARRKKYGLNQMKEEKENLILKFLMYFVGPIQFVMEAAAILAAGLQDWVDFGVICALLLLNAGVGFIQEYQAGSIVDELKKTLALKAVVLRDGRLTEIEAPHVVPGDILQVEEVSFRFCPFTFIITYIL